MGLLSLRLYLKVKMQAYTDSLEHKVLGVFLNAGVSILKVFNGV
jgi:hypothetical protein